MFGMLKPGDDLGLGHDPFDRVRPRVVASQDHLQGDHAVQPALARLVDDAHASPAKLAQDLVSGHFGGLQPREEHGARAVRLTDFAPQVAVAPISHHLHLIGRTDVGGRSATERSPLRDERGPAGSP